MYLIRSARWDDAAELRNHPQLWRRVRRFDLPVQLALAAADEAVEGAEDPATAALLSLAPCNAGSPELLAGIRAVAVTAPTGRLKVPRVNPCVTLHAVDNLALSALSINLGNRAYGLGLGGGPGQAWVALEVARERFDDDREAEVLVVAGDQDTPGGGRGMAVALLFGHRPAPEPGLGKTVRLAAVRRSAGPSADVEPHAAAGLASLLESLAEARGNSWTYEVPAEHGDGQDRIELHWELQ